MKHAIILDKLVLVLSDELWLRVRDLDSRYVSAMGVFHVKTQPKGEYIEFGRLEPTMRVVDMQRD